MADAEVSTVESTEASEWEEAGLDFLSDKGTEAPKEELGEQETISEQAKSQESGEEEAAPETDQEYKKPDEEPGTSDDTEKSGGEAEPEEPRGEDPADKVAADPAAEDRARRRAQLELEADRKELAKDIKEKMFSEIPDRLLDDKGIEIKTVAQVMTYTNPETGENFTDKEASQWLMQAQQHIESKSSEAQSQIDKIVDVNLTLKEDAADVMSQYGDFLKDNPGLKKDLWEDYKATMKISDDGEVIVDAPLSMKRFYDRALQPYVAFAKQKQEAAEAQVKAEADKKAKIRRVQEEKKTSHSDREDVVSTRTKSNEGMDPEEKEWAEAAKEHFEG